MDYSTILEKNDIKVSVPCRIDLGGTLDISTFFLPLNHLDPSTFNIALDIRTYVRLSAWKKGYVKIVSRGFKSAEFITGYASFNHPLGLMFAVAAHFNAGGVCIEIDSTSPPRSALGGSSAAAVAVVAAFLKAGRSCFDKQPDSRDFSDELGNIYNEGNKIHYFNESDLVEKTPVIAHYIEAGVAGVPCGFQDQLAAAYGGVNLWHWIIGDKGPSYIREKIVPWLDCSGSRGFFSSEYADHCDNDINTKAENTQRPEKAAESRHCELLEKFNKHILVAYCGIPHVSKNINKRWVDEFLLGKNRDKWEKICGITNKFSKSVKKGDFDSAKDLMNRETMLRLEMTPDVLDETGMKFFKKAVESGCGARFTGAGGGGCVWAIGGSCDIDNLKEKWEMLIEQHDLAMLLDTKIAWDGILFEA